jgi:hypothetical protein
VCTENLNPDVALRTVAPPRGANDLLVSGPRERLIEMLQAFERFLAVRDGGAANIAFDNIQATLRRGAETPTAPVPNGVVVELAAERDVAQVEINLLNAPNLGPIRNDLDALIGQLKSIDGDAPPPSRAA